MRILELAVIPLIRGMSAWKSQTLDSRADELERMIADAKRAGGKRCMCEHAAHFDKRRHEYGAPCTSTEGVAYGLQVCADCARDCHA